MFPSPGAATTAHILSFNSYICGECFRFPGFSVWCHRRFNLYMCGECFGATKLFWRCYGRRFQLIYVRGMFHVSNAACPSGLSFQLIYVRGMFRSHAGGRQDPKRVSIHICAWNVSNRQKYMTPIDYVSIYICAGNVSCSARPDGQTWCVSTHICTGNVSSTGESV